MRRARQATCRRLSAPGAGLRALAILVARAINDVVPAWVTPARRWPAPAALPMHVEVTPPARAPQPRRRPGRRPRPAPSRRPTAGDRHRDGPADAEPTGRRSSEEHVEIWRLVTRAQDGDGEAFGQLYDRYVDTVFRFIYFRVNDRALAEDFTSETFLRALRRIGTINYQGRDIGAWFVTIARNIILDHMKSARHRLEITTADTLEGKDRAPEPRGRRARPAHQRAADGRGAGSSATSSASA